MAESAAPRYRSRIALLADERAAAEACLGPAVADGVRRVYARAEYGRRPWATLCFQADPGPHTNPGIPTNAGIHDAPSSQTCRGFDDGSGGLIAVEIYERDEAPPEAVLREVGAVVVRPYLADPGLPALAQVVNVYGPADVVRYRPGKRCTLRTTGTTDSPNEGQPTTYVKVVRDSAQAAALFESAKQAWSAACEATTEFVTAEPRWFDRSLGAFGLAAVAGSPVGPGDAPRLAVQIGVALGSLARGRCAPPDVLTVETQIARTRRAVRKIVRLDGDLGRRASELVDELGDAHARLSVQHGDAPYVAVHGSPHIHQWLDTGDRLGLIDFDRFARGHAELDVATLVGELDFSCSPDAVADVLDDVIAGYASVGVPLDRDLIALYRRHKWLARASRLAQAIRPDAIERITDLLDQLTPSPKLG